MSLHFKKFPILKTLSSPRGHVDLLETIGKGNYGYVYKGKISTGIAAIKVVFLKDDEIKETLLEMEILSKCHHEHITAYYGAYLKGSDLWICMEFCGGGSLDSIYRGLKKPLSEDAIASILYETLLALNYLHTEAGLIHRDIKAGNLLLTEDGIVKLADFGVSSLLSSIGGRANTFIGTPYWMAPEVIQCDPESKSTTATNASYDSKSDIWSTGITAIEMAEKNPPLADMHPMRALHLIPKSDLGFAKPKNFSRPFVDFVSSCLVKNPVKRPSAKECLAHPFIAKAVGLPRQKLLTDLVIKVKNIKEKKRLGYDVDEDEVEEVAPKLIQETIHQAKAIQEKAKAVPSLAPPQPLIRRESSTSITPMDATFMAEFSPLSVQTMGDKTLFSPTIVSAIKAEIYTADVLDQRYLLLGSEKGLYFCDLQHPSAEPVVLLRNTRFKQIQILENYNVLVALCGKKDQIRQYRLPSIRRLVRYLCGDNPMELSQTDMNISLSQVVVGSTLKKEDDEEYERVKTKEDEVSLVAKWTSDFIKIPGTKDAKSFHVEVTKTTVYLSLLFRQDMILFEWAREPYLKFMKLKEFWLPDTPKFFQLFSNGLEVNEICVGYATELNLVRVDDSQVTEVQVHRDFLSNAPKQSRWHSFHQIPFSESKLAELVKTHGKQGTVNRKLAAVTGPSGVVSLDRYFLGTYHRTTKVVDIHGTPMQGPGVGGWTNGVQWSQPSLDLILRPLGYVVSIGSNMIEIVDWKSAQLRQRIVVDSGDFKMVSSRPGFVLVSLEKKRKGSLLYWMKEPDHPVLMEKTSSSATVVEPFKDEKQSKEVKGEGGLAVPSIGALKLESQIPRSLVASGPSPTATTRPPLVFEKRSIESPAARASVESAASSKVSSESKGPPRSTVPIVLIPSQGSRPVEPPAAMALSPTFKMGSPGVNQPSALPEKMTQAAPENVAPSNQGMPAQSLRDSSGSDIVSGYAAMPSQSSQVIPPQGKIIPSQSSQSPGQFMPSQSSQGQDIPPQDQGQPIPEGYRPNYGRPVSYPANMRPRYVYPSDMRPVARPPSPDRPMPRPYSSPERSYRPPGIPAGYVQGPPPQGYYPGRPMRPPSQWTSRPPVQRPFDGRPMVYRLERYEHPEQRYERGEPRFDRQREPVRYDRPQYDQGYEQPVRYAPPQPSIGHVRPDWNDPRLVDAQTRYQWEQEYYNQQYWAQQAAAQQAAAQQQQREGHPR